MNTLKRISLISLCIAMLLSLSSCFSTPSIEDIFDIDMDVTLEQKTVYDENGIKITSKSLSENVERNGRLIDPKILLTFDVENTSSENLLITADYLCVNNIMAAAFWDGHCPAGATTELIFELSPPDLSRDGISVIKDIELSFRIENSETYDLITITSPIALKTSADANYVQPLKDEGTVVYDGSEAKIVIYESDDFLRLYVNNKMDQVINVKATCVSINGEEFDGFDCVNNVVPGKHGYANIGFPRDKITEGASNELGIHVVICDNSGQNMAFVKEIKDLGIVTVTVDK